VIAFTLWENGIMRNVFLAFALFVGQTLAQNTAPAGPTATVTFHVIDKDGHTLENCRVDRFARLDNLNTRTHDLEIAPHFTGLQGTQIPFGTYDYVLKRRLSDGREGSGAGRLSIYRTDVLAVIQADTGLRYGLSADGVRVPDRVGINGRIEPMPEQTSELDPIWIRLSPVHGGEQFDVSVNSSGEFRIYGPPNGRYILTVIQGENVLHVQPITFRPVTRAQPFVVKLSNQPPEAITIYEAAGNVYEGTGNQK
jgi:hypothetical protein